MADIDAALYEAFRTRSELLFFHRPKSQDHCRRSIHLFASDCLELSSRSGSWCGPCFMSSFIVEASALTWDRGQTGALANDSGRNHLTKSDENLEIRCKEGSV
jgi:hypothetical protein